MKDLCGSVGLKARFNRTDSCLSGKCTINIEPFLSQCVSNQVRANSAYSSPPGCQTFATYSVREDFITEDDTASFKYFVLLRKCRISRIGRNFL